MAGAGKEGGPWGLAIPDALAFVPRNFRDLSLSLGSGDIFKRKIARASCQNQSRKRIVQWGNTALSHGSNTSRGA